MYIEEREGSATWLYRAPSWYLFTGELQFTCFSSIQRICKSREYTSGLSADFGVKTRAQTWRRIGSCKRRTKLVFRAVFTPWLQILRKYSYLHSLIYNFPDSFLRNITKIIIMPRDNKRVSWMVLCSMTWFSRFEEFEESKYIGPIGFNTYIMKTNIGDAPPDPLSTD